MNRFLRRNGLSIVVLGLFLAFWAGQLGAGFAVHNQERLENGDVALSFARYLRSSHAIEATAENWESEFLQMCAYVVFTAVLFQRGSAESHDPDAKPPRRPKAVSPEAPWPVRRGGIVLKVYEHSLSLVLAALFLVSFALHAIGGAGLYNEEQISDGNAPVTVAEYLGTPHFWFESFQNWQSEFLSIGAMVLLSIFLREKNSPESKRVETPHFAHES